MQSDVRIFITLRDSVVYTKTKLFNYMFDERNGCAPEYNMQLLTIFNAIKTAPTSLIENNLCFKYNNGTKLLCEVSSKSFSGEYLKVLCDEFVKLFGKDLLYLYGEISGGLYEIEKIVSGKKNNDVIIIDNN